MASSSGSRGARVTIPLYIQTTIGVPCPQPKDGTKM